MIDITAVKKEVAVAVRKMYPSAPPKALSALIQLHLGYELWYIMAGVRAATYPVWTHKKEVK